MIVREGEAVNDDRLSTLREAFDEESARIEEGAEAEVTGSEALAGAEKDQLVSAAASGAPRSSGISRSRSARLSASGTNRSSRSATSRNCRFSRSSSTGS